jgi:hypothetical protein
MLYLFKVYALVAVIVFGCSGIVMLAMLSWNQAREYAVARQAMRRIARPSFSRDSREIAESFAISRH